MLVLALLIPPVLLAAVVLLARFEERVFTRPERPRRPALPQRPHRRQRTQLRLVVQEPGAPEPRTAQLPARRAA
ncbi:hypothetical protein [Streptomyces sp. CB03911]|uniref:hypothetical protein n=1 Tax=Streptomycetaceae TaxID=2062 RepID=UPI0009396639|nr:hypothetical protein [Streptomyces sp. CB03911]OKI12588.1 hypothetical protein A6A07_16990 [Streptomyces sp. CB03911]